MTDTISLVALDAIQLRNRLRPISEADMFALAASFAEKGQDQPILCRPCPDGSNRIRLVAGAHRVAAARYLEWPSIKAIIRPMTDDEARLAEIDENVIRRELSTLDRAIFLAERKAVYERLHPEVTHGGKRVKLPATGQVANMATLDRYTKDAAKKTGLSERTIRRAAELCRVLSPEVIDAIRSTPLANNGGALKKLSYLAPEQQLGAAKALQAGQAKNLKGALVAAGFAPAPILSDPAYILIERWKDVLSRQSATMRRALIMEALRTVRPGEFTALANELAKRLPVSRQKQIAKALEETLAAYGEDA